MKTLSQTIRNLSKEQFLQLKEYCHRSNSLYNCALYEIKKYYEETGKFLRYESLYHVLKANYHYIQLPRKIACQILKLAEQNYKSFFALIKTDSVARPPKYKKKGDTFCLVLPNQQITYSSKRKELKITKKIKLPFTYEIQGAIKQAIITYKHDRFKIFIQYEEKETIKPETIPENWLSVDFGLNNLATCASNVGQSFIINGKPLKSYNKYYNKRKAIAQSELQIKNNKYWSKFLSTLTYNRDNWINNYLNQSVSLIASYCVSNKIGTVVIGYNKEWKQEINIGKVNNQSFVGIPHYKFKQKLESKLESFGIFVIEQEESYTSKCSSLDNEPIEKHETYLGKRIKRGLFKSSNNININADVNGALNIFRKYSQTDFTSNEIEAFRVSPVKINPIYKIIYSHI